MRDAFFASPQFPRLLQPSALRETIARGVREGYFGYGELKPDVGYEPFCFKKSMTADAVEISDDAVLFPKEKAERLIQPARLETLLVYPAHAQMEPGDSMPFRVEGLDQHGRDYALDEVTWEATGGAITPEGHFAAAEDEGNFMVKATSGAKSGSSTVTITTGAPPPPLPTPRRDRLVWSGEIPPQKWTTFYMQVLTRLVAAGEVKLSVRVEARPKGGVRDQQVEEMKTALRGLGLTDDAD